jgi:hypothetical protein
MNNIPLRDVHVYDGSITFVPKNNFPHELKDKAFKEFLKVVDDPHAKACIEMIINDKSGNIDNANKIDASDLFAEILTFRLDNDAINLISEQLKDCFLLGRCPQGRTTRLFQILQYLKG